MVRTITALGFALVLGGCGGAAPGGPASEPADSGPGATSVDAAPDASPIEPVDAGVVEDAMLPGDSAVPTCTNPSAWYPDADGDGFGDAKASPTMSCVAPAHFVADHTDCADTDANAHPGQTHWFTTPIQGASGYDYDCDGKEEVEWKGTGFCESSGAGCVVGSSANVWFTNQPACGVVGDWISSCNSAGKTCASDIQQQTQACH